MDTHVLSAIWDNEESALRRIDVLGDGRHQGSVVVCGAVYADTLAHPSMSESTIRQFLAETEIRIDSASEEQVWTEAGRRYSRYAERQRESGQEQPTRILADFLIGTHALMKADRLVTLDQRLYRTDFPNLELL